MLITDTALIDRYYKALLERDEAFLGVFLVGVKTTGIFCLPTCRARKPLRKNVVFYSELAAVQRSGFRACKVCRPTEKGLHIPDYVTQTLALLHTKPSEKISDAVLIDNSIDPVKVRRWFKCHYQLTFHAFQRQFRMQQAHLKLRNGERVTDAAFGSGYESLSGFGAAFRKVIGQSPNEARLTD